MRYQFRPLGQWTDPETDPRRSSSVFKADWKDTLVLLADELTHLEAVEPVVLQVDVDEADVRLDGMLRAHVKPRHPGVVISFDSRYGPLRYATDAHEEKWFGSMPGWQANVRAIALALVALRAVDRYGVTRRGEQYTGWKALPASTGTTFPSADEALRWMRAQTGDTGTEPSVGLVYRKLARRLHPDANGDPGEWEKLQAAKLLLTTAGML